MKVDIFSDGAARGNPDGPGGYGTILRYVNPKDGQVYEKELSQGYTKTTNNRMELMAAIAGFECLNRPCEVTLHSDSQYVIKAFTEHWIDSWLKTGWKKNTVKNIDLWKRLLKAMEPHTVSFEWVKGHNGHPENERCDRLATGAADHGPLIDDIVEMP